MEEEFVIPLNIDDLLHNESPLYVVREVASLRELPTKIECKELNLLFLLLLLLY